MEDKKVKKETIYNLVLMENRNLIDIIAFRQRKSAHAYMAIASFYAKNSREQQGITDCEIDIKSDNNIVVSWNGGVNTLSFDLVKSTLK
jgi:hypothetical protein